MTVRSAIENTISIIANVSKESKDAQINWLIKKLNKSYDSIRNFKMKNYV